MVDIEDREMLFKSHKAYAKFLKIEVKKLQQILTTQEIQNCYFGAKRDYLNRVK